MERMITTAWSAFWVALGASVVLVGQSLFVPSPAPAMLTPAAPAIVAPHPETPAISQRPAVVRVRRVARRG